MTIIELAWADYLLDDSGDSFFGNHAWSMAVDIGSGTDVMI